MQRALDCRYFKRAFGWCVPIGGLAGLVGLGGGEFRLPVLMYAVGFDARAAVPLNLLTSLVTLAFALLVRSGSIALGDVAAFLPAVLGLLGGGMLSGFYGASLVSRLSDERLVKLISLLLGALGVLLLAEAVLPFGAGGLSSSGTAVQLGAGIAIGLGVGIVSSVLGVAGGELLIPALIFVFGADIRTAGSASILISLGVVTMGLVRYGRARAIPAWTGARRIAAAMAAGSIIGAVLGGLAVAYAPVAFLKVVLGLALVAAAAKTFTHR